MNSKMLLFIVVITTFTFTTISARCPHDFEEAFLHKHNELRKHHGAGALHLDGAISIWAQQWADHLASSNKFEHRPHNKYGENLWMISGSAQFLHPHGDVPVNSWYAEKSKYHWFGKEPDMRNFHEWGHFTQLVWKGSHSVGVGCGRAGNRLVVVANYSPPGNYVGRYHNNV